MSRTGRGFPSHVTVKSSLLFPATLWTASALLAGGGALIADAQQVSGLVQFTNPIPYLPEAVGVPPGFNQEAGIATPQVVADTSEPFSDRSLNATGGGGLDDLTWTAPGAHQDCEALALVQIEGTVVNGQRYPTLGVRAQSGVMSGYFFCFDAASGAGGTQVEIAKFMGGVYDGGSTGTFTWAVGTWYWVRINDTSNVRHARIWQQGTAEPGTWLI